MSEKKQKEADAKIINEKVTEAATVEKVEETI